MENFIKALVAYMLVGVGQSEESGNILARAQESLDLVKDRVGVVQRFVLEVERACFHGEIHWCWDSSEYGVGQRQEPMLNLRVWHDDPAHVERILRPFLSGWDCTEDGGVDWDGDTFTEHGWITLRPVPQTPEFDGYQFTDYAAMMPA